MKSINCNNDHCVYLSYVRLVETVYITMTM